MSVTITATFPMTEKPAFLSHFEITRDGDRLLIHAVNRRDIIYAETEMAAEDFFKAIDKLKD